MNTALWRLYLSPSLLLRASVMTAALAAAMTIVTTGPDQAFRPWLAFLIVPFGWALVARNPTGAYSELEATLPVDSRGIILTRTAAMAFAWLVPVWSAGFAVTTIGAWLEKDTLPAITLTLALTAAITLCAVIAYRPHRRVPGISGRAVLFVPPIIALAARNLEAAAIMFFVAVTIEGVVLLRAQPAITQPQARAEKTRSLRGGSSTSVNRFLLRRVFGSWLVLLMIFCGVGQWWSAIQALTFGGEVVHLPLMGAIFAALPFTMAMSRLVGFEHLPIARKRLLVHALAPTLCVVVLGTLLGVSVHSGRDVSILVQMDQQGSDPRYEVHVPWKLWRISDGTPPVVRSPAGESYQPVGTPLWAGTQWQRYNPYEVGYARDVKRSFVGYQLQRLLRDCCQLELSIEDATARYVTNPAVDGEKKNAFFRVPYRASIQSRIVAVLLLTLLTLAVSLAMVRPNPPVASRRELMIRRATSSLSFVFIVGGMLAGIHLFNVDEHSMMGLAKISGANTIAGANTASAFASLVAEWAHVTQNYFPFVVLALGLGIAGSYRMLQRTFEALEATAPTRLWGGRSV